MLKTTDFKVDHEFLYFRKDRYPMKRINNVRLKQMSLFENIAQMAFWLFLFAGPVWLAMTDWHTEPLWFKGIAVSMTAVGLVFGFFRCSRVALQIEFKHGDETGTQWVNVTKSFSVKDSDVLQQQAQVIRTAL